MDEEISSLASPLRQSPTSQGSVDDTKTGSFDVSTNSRIKTLKTIYFCLSTNSNSNFVCYPQQISGSGFCKMQQQSEIPVDFHHKVLKYEFIGHK